MLFRIKWRITAAKEICYIYEVDLLIMRLIYLGINGERGLPR